MIRSTTASTALAFTLMLSVPALTQGVSGQEAYEIAKDAYVYAYPLVVHDLTRVQATNVVEPAFPHMPPNQFSHAPAFPPPEMKIVVRPNADTLYSAAWLDLGPEPVVLSVPATDRYFMLPMLSAWTDVFAVPGTRTTGRNRAVNFLVAAPNWQGDVPVGLKLTRAPTRYVAIIGRTQTNGPADYEAVHKVQAAFKLTPLSAWGKVDYVPPKGKVDPSIDMNTPPPVQVDRMDAATFFRRFAELLKDDPPGPFDYPMIDRLERVGLKGGQSFDLNAASPETKQAFERGTADGKAQVLAEGGKAAGEGGKGWIYRTNGGTYGTDYLYRAAIAQCCLGYNLPQDAVYPSLSVDSEGRPLDGSGKYVLRFEKGKLPPVDAFWSVTVYDKDGFFIPNVLNRQALGDRSNLVANADGSIDLNIQVDSPGKDKEANWLPVAAGQPFNLLMRLYSPREEILNGAWTPPPVKKVM